VPSSPGGSPPGGDALLLRGVRLGVDGAAATARWDVGVAAGRVRTVTAAGTLPAARGEPDGAGAAQQALDLDGYVLLPAPVEPHAHLDKADTATSTSSHAGDLDGAVTAWLAYRDGARHEDVVARATAAGRRALTCGATTVRTHVDVGGGAGLRMLAGVLQAREALRGLVDVQVVAMAHEPLSGREGAEHRALLADALAAGADAVGGAPYRDADPPAALRACLEAAGAASAPVDLHTDETLDPDVLTLADLADAVHATGFAHGVTASHAVSLGTQEPAVAADVARRVARAGVAVVCLPATNLFLQGRAHTSAIPRGLTALRALADAGVTVAAGGDNVRDPFNPLGRGDPLETAALLVLAGHVDPVAAYAAVSTQARAALGLPPVTVTEGAPADLLAVRADGVADALATATPDRVVVRGGEVVARTQVSSWVAHA
jgi:cytosine/creatinine deaminase